MNKNHTSTYLLAVLLICLTSLLTCSNDKLPEPTGPDCMGIEPTYTNNLRVIIDETCAYSGCHLDSAPGQFNTYAGLLPYLEDKTFMQRVITMRADAEQGMPPNTAPVGRPQDLTEEQILTIQCWLEAGFPE